MKSYSIQVGDRFGRWTVTGEAFNRKLGEGESANYPRYYPCRCDCGTERGVRAFKLLANSRSCGCWTDEQRCAKLRKGGRDTRLYSVWRDMNQRCRNPRNTGYKWYGARGITICEDWTSFDAFNEWAQQNGAGTPEYEEKRLQIDRIDVNGPYAPGNCRFVTDVVNKQNLRTNHNITALGETRSAAAWARDNRCNVSPTIIVRRMKVMGWTADAAILTPRLSRRGGTMAHRKLMGCKSP